jgi:mannose-1-phosphate guanylyltransferase
MYAAILAGGAGTRLWPRSRKAHPKQFTDMTGSGRTMIQATVDRLDGLVSSDSVYVVTGPDYAALAALQLPQLRASQLIVEPSARNTAPAIGLACIALRKRDPNAVLAILPADHIIADSPAFRTALARAHDAAQAGFLATLGIQPEFAHTGYGYIQRGEPIDTLSTAQGALPVYSIRSFLEKPDRAMAESFLREGGYYWNGGIFVFRVDAMLEEIQRQLPAMHDALQAIAAELDTPLAAEVLARHWSSLPATSIDYGIMEGARHAAVVPLVAGWNDVGSWDALEAVLERDANDNLVARHNAVSIDSWGNIVYADKAVVALIGVDDLVVVEDGNALLIGHKHQMQKVKDVVEILRKSRRDDVT